MKYFIPALLILSIGFAKISWVPGNELNKVTLHGQIIATRGTSKDSIYILNLKTKEQINLDTKDLIIVGVPIWGKDGSVLLPTVEGILEIKDNNQVFLSHEKPLSFVYSKERNQIFYVNGKLELKTLSITDKSERILQTKNISSVWISNYNNKLAVASRNGTEIFDLEKNTIIKEIAKCKYYTFSSNDKVAYIREATKGEDFLLIVEDSITNKVKKINAPWGNNIIWSPDGNYLFFTDREPGFPYQTSRAKVYDLNQDKVYILWRKITLGGLRARSWKD